MCRGLTVAAAMLLLTAGTARADGVRVEGRLTTRTVVKRSSIIFVGKVVRVAHKKAVRQAYGRTQRWIRRYELQVRVVKALRGGSELKGARTIWVGHANPMIPGKWVVISQAYATLDLMAEAKVGQELILYLGGAVLRRGKWWKAELYQADAVAALPIVERLLKAARRRAAIEARRNARCKRPGTYYARGKCHTAEALRPLLNCPPGTRPRTHLRRNSLDHYCARPNVVAHGPYERYTRAGERVVVGTKQKGAWHGAVTFFYPAGPKEKVVTYRRGKEHGSWQRFHRNGRLARAGTMWNGRADGLWQAWNAAGQLLGQFRLRRGTGTVTEWHSNGKKHRVLRYLAGQLHGPYAVWYASGLSSLRGQYRRGRSHGKWYHYNAKGLLEVITCYRNEREIWDTTDIATGKRRRCP